MCQEQENTDPGCRILDGRYKRHTAHGSRHKKDEINIILTPYTLRLTPCAINSCLPEFEIEGCLSLFTKKIDKNIRTVGDDTVDTRFDEALHVIF